MFESVLPKGTRIPTSYEEIATILEEGGDVWYCGDSDSYVRTGATVGYFRGTPLIPLTFYRVKDTATADIIADLQNLRKELTNPPLTSKHLSPTIQPTDQRKP